MTDQLGHGDCVSWLTRFGIQVSGWFIRYTSSNEALIRTMDGHMFRVPLDNPTLVRAEFTHPAPDLGISSLSVNCICIARPDFRRGGRRGFARGVRPRRGAGTTPRRWPAAR